MFYSQSGSGSAGDSYFPKQPDMTSESVCSPPALNTEGLTHLANIISNNYLTTREEICSALMAMDVSQIAKMTAATLISKQGKGHYRLAGIRRNKREAPVVISRLVAYILFWKAQKDLLWNNRTDLMGCKFAVPSETLCEMLGTDCVLELIDLNDKQSKKQCDVALDDAGRELSKECVEQLAIRLGIATIVMCPDDWSPELQRVYVEEGVQGVKFKYPAKEFPAVHNFIKKYHDDYVGKANMCNMSCHTRSLCSLKQEINRVVKPESTILGAPLHPFRTSKLSTTVLDRQHPDMVWIVDPNLAKHLKKDEAPLLSAASIRDFAHDFKIHRAREWAAAAKEADVNPGTDQLDGITKILHKAYHPDKSLEESTVDERDIDMQGALALPEVSERARAEAENVLRCGKERMEESMYKSLGSCHDPLGGTFYTSDLCPSAPVMIAGVCTSTKSTGNFDSSKSQQSPSANELKKVSKLKAQLKRCTQEKEKLNKEKENIERDLERANDEIQQLKKGGKTTSDEYKTLQATIQKLQQSAQTKDNEIQILQQNEAEYDKQFNELQSYLKQCNLEKSQLLNELQTEQAAKEKSELEIESLKKQITRLTQDKTDLESRLRKVTTERDNLKKAGAQQPSQIVTLNTEIAELKNEITQKTSNIKKLKTQVEALTKELTAKDKEIVKLTESQQAQSSTMVTTIKTSTLSAKSSAKASKLSPTKTQPAPQSSTSTFSFGQLPPKVSDNVQDAQELVDALKKQAPKDSGLWGKLSEEQINAIYTKILDNPDNETVLEVIGVWNGTEREKYLESRIIGALTNEFPQLSF